MKVDNWKYVKKLHDDESVINFLDRYKITLPKELIKIIEKFNGGRPVNNAFDTDYREEYVFKSLLSYNENDTENIYGIYEEFKGMVNFPLASDASGNFICYNLEEKKYVLMNTDINQIENITKCFLLDL